MARHRVALIHDWLTGMRGGERVLEGLLDLFPDAEIFTLVHVPGTVSARIESRPIHVSHLGRLPGVDRRYRFLLPFFPSAIERFDLRGFDLVVSSSHCVAKGAIAPPGVPHICYCHTPMRYVWDQYADYFSQGRASPLIRMAASLVMPRLRRWDVASAAGVSSFIANSRHVRERIRRHYERDAAVVYPPVEVKRFAPAPRREDYYISIGALVPYKRMDIAVRAFNQLGRRLIVVGEGPELHGLSRKAHANVEFTGRLPDDEVARLLAGARGFVLPGEEDFGIAAVEAQAAGVPVIALGRGGALETVIAAPAAAGANGRLHHNGASPHSGNWESGAHARGNGRGRNERFIEVEAEAPTGVFFDQPTPAALAAAVARFEPLDFDTRALRRQAERFNPRIFRDRMRAQLRATLEPHDATVSMRH